MESFKLLENVKQDSIKNINNIEEIKVLIANIDEIFLSYFKEDRNDLLKSKISEVIKLIDDNLTMSSNTLSKVETGFLYFAKSVLLDKLPDYSKQKKLPLNQ